MEKEIINTNIGVIGSAGRKEDGDKFTKEVYMRAFYSLYKFLMDMQALNPGNQITLVSGGAGFSDHMAVHMYLLQYVPCKLKLHLPCAFVDGKFEDNGDKDWKKNPGSTANHYHSLFSKKMEIDSLNEIKSAIENGAEVDCGGGFFGRNQKVADDCDTIIAFTFGHMEQIKDGGTADTCKKFLKKNHKELLYHVDLHSPDNIHWPAEVEPKIYT